MLHTISQNQQKNLMLHAQRRYVLEAGFTSGQLGDNTLSGRTDRVSILQETSITLTYSSSMSLEADPGAGYRSLQKMVADLLHDQGAQTMVTIDDQEVDLSELTPEEAQERIAPEGYFGVEKTSERIFQFAVGVAGQDPTRIDAIKEGIEQGFQEALDAFGGWLPDISYQTFDTVMDKLDTWVNQAQKTA